MCCMPINEDYSEEDIKGYCEECGCPLDEDGDPLDGCEKGTLECEYCGWSPCDGFC